MVSRLEPAKTGRHGGKEAAWSAGNAGPRQAKRLVKRTGVWRATWVGLCPTLNASVVRPNFELVL